MSADSPDVTGIQRRRRNTIRFRIIHARLSRAWIFSISAVAFGKVASVI
ncbi:MAG: hypothetical protein IKP58_02705 [Victivallales bacterium]|nr:hypothetical protein [Victivallales bacterium]